jgi:uncharacterized protein (DUF362 family)
MGTPVSLVRVDRTAGDLKEYVKKSLDLIGFKSQKTVNSVVIKPNLAYYWDWTTGYTTDPRVVAALIDMVREWHGPNVDIKIAEADASAMRTKHAFPVLGYERLARDEHVELVNLSNGNLEDHSKRIGGREISLKVPELLLKCDLFINVPKLKVMRAVKITCAMKNVFGCIGAPKKMVYHPVLNETIVAMNMILRPHLTVVDGIVALGTHPVKLGLLMAGTDTFSVDWVASQVMGYKPSGLRFLKLYMKEKGESSEGIVTRGERVEEFRKLFPKPSFSSSGGSWKLMFWLLKAYRKTSGDIIPPVLQEGE